MLWRQQIFPDLVKHFSQARVLMTNIRMHPIEYTPKPPPEDHVDQYTFFHKEGQPMAIPIKRVSYNDNFYRGTNIELLRLHH